MKEEQNGEIILYQTDDGTTKIEVRVEGETVWLTQAKIAELFGIERSVISKHLRNIFEEGELEENSVCAKFAHTATDSKTCQTNVVEHIKDILEEGELSEEASCRKFRQVQIEGKRNVSREIPFYNLDMIISDEIPPVGRNDSAKYDEIPPVGRNLPFSCLMPEASATSKPWIKPKLSTRSFKQKPFHRLNRLICKTLKTFRKRLKKKEATYEQYRNAYCSTLP